MGGVTSTCGWVSIDAIRCQQQNAQDEALQAYLDQMSMLLLEKDLRNSDENSEG